MSLAARAMPGARVAAALFVSDVHLSKARPDMHAAFVRLLRGQAREAGALYILGDLFD